MSENLRELEKTVLQDMAKAVSFYTSLGLTRDSDIDAISKVAKERAREKFEDPDNDRSMKQLIKGQEYFLGSIRDMLSTKENYRNEYANRLNTLKLEDSDSLEDQLQVLF